MPAIQRISDRMALADIVAFDRDDKPVLVVAAEEDLGYPIVIYSYWEVLSAIKKDIPYAILAFADEMTIYRKDRTRRLQTLATIPTREVVRYYNPGGADGPLSKGRIAGMIHLWLMDFSDHWKSSTPPFSGTMASVGLADRLEDGRTKERVRLACLPVRGDQLPPELRDRAERGNGSHPFDPSAVTPTGHAQRLPDGGALGLPGRTETPQSMD